jgi:hypothetical protein
MHDRCLEARVLIMRIPYSNSATKPMTSINQASRSAIQQLGCPAGRRRGNLASTPDRATAIGQRARISPSQRTSCHAAMGVAGEPELWITCRAPSSCRSGGSYPPDML